MLGVLFAVIGVGLTLSGYIWGIVVGFQNGGTLWGVLNIFLSPITPIIMAIQGKINWNPVILQIVGCILLFVAPIVFAMSVSVR